jgi:hypothetical protein
MKKPTGIEIRIVGGIDTHKDSHTAAALNTNGKFLGGSTFPNPPVAIRLCWIGFVPSGRSIELE